MFIALVHERVDRIYSFVVALNEDVILHNVNYNNKLQNPRSI
jgi:hypothetical protein